MVRPKSKPKVDWEEVFYQQCLAIGLPVPIREHLGIEGRKFRFDFMFTLSEDEGRDQSGQQYHSYHQRIVVEIEGGTWGRSSRHTSKVGFANDCIKYNLATRQGYEVYRFTSDKVKSGEAVNFIREVVVERENGVRDYPVWTQEAYPQPG